MNFKRILVVKKTPKIKNLIKKWGIDTIKQSVEYPKLNQAFVTHEENSKIFVETLKRFKDKYFTDLVVSSDGYDESLLTVEKLKNYDLVFTLGGDGCFLRAAHFIEDSNKLLVGINTDSLNSRGFFCSVNNLTNIEEKLDKILSGNIKERRFKQLSAYLENQKKSYSFINDIYFGEQSEGKVSKYELMLNERKNIIKSSGIIISTYQGYTGWILNANTITFKKFDNVVHGVLNFELNDADTVKLYKEKIRIPDYKNDDYIYYFVREPAVRHESSEENLKEYVDYMNFMEGSAKDISIRNYCFSGSILLDGSFSYLVEYNEKIHITLTNHTLNTIEHLF